MIVIAALDLGSFHDFRFESEYNRARAREREHGVRTSTDLGLPNQSRSYPPIGSSRALAKNVNPKKGSLEDASIHMVYRYGSPPKITFGPNGRQHTENDPPNASSSYPPTRNTRSPSPARASSLDARGASPSRNSSNFDSAISLPSTSVGTSSACTDSPIPDIQSTSGQTNRCLSPLPIAASRTSLSDGAGVLPTSPFGTLQPDLYHRQGGPIILKTHSTKKNLGRLHLRMKYDFNKSDLDVHLIEAHDLTCGDDGGFYDPYVKVILKPEVDTKKRQTQVYRNNQNPLFDQCFKFPVSYDQLEDKILHLQVLDNNRSSKNDVLGTVKVDIYKLQLVSSTSAVEIWGEIEKERRPREELQEILVALSYLPNAERLTVLILEARNLFPPEQLPNNNLINVAQDKEAVDAFVKVTLYGEKKVKKKKKTCVKKATTSPVWNEVMSFSLPVSSLATSAIEVCVMDSSSELIGGHDIGSCIIGPSTKDASTKLGREHWMQMMHSPRKQCAEWHTLH